MNLLRSLSAVASASGEGAIDWGAVADAATDATDPGSLAFEPGEREAFATDVREASERIRDTTGLPFPTPSPIEVQDRHHWIEANVDTFQRALVPLQERPSLLPGVARRANTATMATLLAVLGRSVLGQYDPVLFGDGEPRLFFVRPNLVSAEETLPVEPARFRRWIAFHEVAHAAEFGAAPWLVDHLEAGIERALDALADGRIDAEAVRELNATMTAVEGYAEFVMDHAFDARSDDLRAALDARRRSGGPLMVLVRKLFGLGFKRQQYERGKAFFDHVGAARGMAAAGVVWRTPETLPRRDELDDPDRWLDRVDP